jgi:hypothetical protein
MVWVNDDKGWIIYQKIMTIVLEMFCILMLALVITAWIKGT